jgi:K+-transporting ATPase ATPase C chain
MLQQLLPAFRMTLLFTILTGLIYPGAITGLCQLIFPGQANGSLVKNGAGQVIGSSLLGQNFARPEYFHPRPSAAGKDGYDGTASGGSNLGPTNPDLTKRIAADIAKFRNENPDYKGPIPADLLTTSGSGLDPDISPASAEAQVARVAKARGTTAGQVQNLVAQSTEGRTLGVLGEPRVNVLQLNLALDRALPLKK